jgi:hypothetical protein
MRVGSSAMGAVDTEGDSSTVTAGPAVRTVVKVGLAHAELLNDLLALPASIRAQRLVFLAAVGQQSIAGGGLPGRRSAVDPGPPGPSPNAEAPDSRRLRLLDGMGGFGMDDLGSADGG